MSGKKVTTDAEEILRRRYIDGDAERLVSVELERLRARVARRRYDRMYSWRSSPRRPPPAGRTT